MTKPDVMPRATEHIPQMVTLLERLLAAGHAYRTEDGSVFFRIASWPAYGRLARLDPDQLRVGERVAADEYSKDDVRDFVLWKGPREGEPSWETAVGPGRPGWHLECSAMSMHYLGESFDIHTGGVDLVFPHHEDEIAQSEAATGKPFVGHVASLRPPPDGWPQDGEVGGQHRPGRGHPRRGHVAARPSLRAPRCPLPDGAQLQRRFAVGRHGGRGAPRRGRGGAGGLSTPPARTTPPCRASWPRRARRSGTALDDDLAISPALGALFDLVRDLNRRIAERTLSSRDAGVALGALRDLDAVLGLLPDPVDALPADLAALLDARAAARAERDWAASDRLRDELAAAGIVVEDSRDGQRWRRAGGSPGA